MIKGTFQIVDTLMIEIYVSKWLEVDKNIHDATKSHLNNLKDYKF